MKQKTKNKKGFSLIEIIIYLAIFTMISLLVINSLLIVISSFTTIQTNKILLEAGMNSMERVSRDIRQSDSIDLINSNFSGGVLQLNTTNDSGLPATVKFSDENSKLDLYEDNILSGNLLGPDVLLDKLTFRRINTKESEAVKIEMTIHNINSTLSKKVNFYDTITLRGSYK